MASVCDLTSYKPQHSFTAYFLASNQPTMKSPALTRCTQSIVHPNHSLLCSFSLLGASSQDLDKDSAAVAPLVDTVLRLRALLLEALGSWMDCGMGGEALSSHYATAASQLQCEAFRLVGDLRLLYPQKQADYDLVKPLAWTPSVVREASVRVDHLCLLVNLIVTVIRI